MPGSSGDDVALRTEELNRLDREIAKARSGPAEAYAEALKRGLAACESDPDAAEYLDVLELHSQLAETYDQIGVVVRLGTQVQEVLRRPPPGRVAMSTARLQITMREVVPRVERAIDVPAAITLDELHEVLQGAIGRTYSHLHQFRTDATIYAVPFEGWGDREAEVDERGVPLSALPPRFVYAYDLGDGWEHDVQMLGRGGDVPGCRWWGRLPARARRPVRLHRAARGAGQCPAPRAREHAHLGR